MAAVINRVVPLLGQLSLPAAKSEQSHKSFLRTNCQLENNIAPTQAREVFRRSVVVVLTSAAAVAGFAAQPNAEAGKRKPPPPPQEKKPEDDKNLSAYDARLLANARRKEELKKTVAAQKATAKSVAGQVTQAPAAIFTLEN